MTRLTKTSLLWCVVILGLVALFGGFNYASATGAAYFAQDTTVSLSAAGSGTYTIIGGSDADSVVTDGSTTITVTISSGETFTLVSSAHYRLDNDNTFTSTCDSANDRSKLIISPSTSIVVIITPNPNIVLCSSGSGSSGGGGGGGGGGSTASTPTPTPVVTLMPTPTPVATWTPAPYYQQTVSGNSKGQGASTSNLGSFVRNLSFGMRGNDIKNLQIYLKSLGLLKATPNGIYGPATRAAVASWQKKNKLPAVGAFGPQSRALYKKLVP